VSSNNYKRLRPIMRLVMPAVAATLGALCSQGAQAAAPGIADTGTANAFKLNAGEAFISQPDGASVYSWGYGCAAGSSPTFVPSAINAPSNGCSTMQIPGPTLIVTHGQTIRITLTNNLPAAAGNTSILFPGFKVQSTGGVDGLLTKEAAHGGSVTYTFVADKLGTHSYYSGTQADLQVEMGLYGAIIVVPSAGDTIPAACATSLNDQARTANSESDFRHGKTAYLNKFACYDREYLFQFSEMDPRIHRQVEEQKQKNASCTKSTGCLNVITEPYLPSYYMINGRSMPDDMDPNYAMQYPHQPYNGNPHMHPGELVLLRVIGQGRWQHPFHEHGNHVRVLARDGNLLVSNANDASDSNPLAGPLLFTTTTTPGQALDGIFYWTGKGLNWDVFGHGYTGDTTPCVPDANGYYTSVPAAPNFYEWCGDHDKALEQHPFGQVGSGGPVTLPDANITALGAWFGGSPYLGGEATSRAVGSTPIPPSGTVGNSPSDEGGFAFMWHSHNEREITTNNIFPGGMMMMMIVDPRKKGDGSPLAIDEGK
jgi:FtsP/CotA-like multicopper oxidase with cupredoxin domain